MSVDSRDKRMSLIGFGLPILVVLPNPDGTIGTQDRAMLLWLYHGIALEAAEVAEYIGVLGIWVLGGRDVEIGRPLNTSVVFDMPEREVELDMSDYAAKRGVPIREVEIEV